MFYGIAIAAELLFLFLLSKQLTRTLSHFLYTLKFNQTWSTLIIALLFLPGTFVHEMAHVIMAHLLFVPTGAISLWPKLEGPMIRMGSVAVAKVDILRSLLIGLAPFITGLTILFLAFALFLSHIHSLNYWLIGLFVYLLFVITYSMFSSKKDLEGAGFFVILILLAIIFLYFFDKEFLQQAQALISLIPQNYTLLVIRYLAAPIGLDISLIIVLRLLIRIFN